MQECHAEVPVEIYLKRCIFDTCACDQGGDCECLCTAVAAYAHACSQKGINIRWRTPHFCRKYYFTLAHTQTYSHKYCQVLHVRFLVEVWSKKTCCFTFLILVYVKYILEPATVLQTFIQNTYELWKH